MHQEKPARVKTLLETARLWLTPCFVHLQTLKNTGGLQVGGGREQPRGVGLTTPKKGLSKVTGTWSQHKENLLCHKGLIPPLLFG